MSDDEPTPDDQALLAALAMLEGGEERTGDAAEAETLARLYHEVFGLLPAALPPAAPPPGVKERLMAAILGESAGTPPTGAGPPQAAEAAGVAAPVPFPTAGPRRSRSWLPLPLAAALIVALLGACGWLVLGLREQGRTIAGLGRQRDDARQHAGQHWYMSLRGLPPAGRNRVYQLWFVADGGPVSGGTFTTEAGKPWELSSEHMPAGTRAVRITLENGAGAPAPSGPDVLRNAGALHAI